MNMAESIPGDLFNPVPCIHLKPVPTEEYDPKDVYDCPLVS